MYGEALDEDIKPGLTGDVYEGSVAIAGTKRKQFGLEMPSPRPTRKPKQEPEDGPPFTTKIPVKSEDFGRMMVDDESDLELEAMEVRKTQTALSCAPRADGIPHRSD